jgi:protein arginine kinase
MIGGNKMSLEEKSNIVFSSRIRFARNLEGFAFPYKLNDDKRNEVIDRIRRTLTVNNIMEKKFNYIDMGDIDPIYKLALVEKHLISLELFSANKPSGLILSEDEKIGIMINEEDHLRIQCILPGLELVNAMRMSMEIDSILENDNKFAFNSQFGYLTACPTNIGTGMRASVMLHLPALTLTGYINEVIQACGRLGLTARGLYGENSDAKGDMYQISNQKTLGYSEEGIVNNVINVAAQIIEQEKNIRNDIYAKNKYRLEDKIMRAYGILTTARVITSDESLKLISDIRWGIDSGIIQNIESEKLDFLLTAIGAGCIQKEAGRNIDPEERDIHRATIIRTVLGK